VIDKRERAVSSLPESSVSRSSLSLYLFLAKKNLREEKKKLFQKNSYPT